MIRLWIWILNTISRTISIINLNEAGASSMKRKFHRRNYINILVSIYLSLNWQERLAIDKLDRDWWNENVIDKLYLILKSKYLKYFKSLESERKFELNISNEMWKRVFISGVGSYIFTYLGYVPGLYFVSSRMWQLSTYLEEGKV